MVDESIVPPEEEKDKKKDPFDYLKPDTGFGGGDRSLATNGVWVAPEDKIEPMGFFEAVGEGTDHWITSAASRNEEMERMFGDAEPLEKLTPELFQRFSAGLGESQKEWVLQGKSLPELEWRYDYAMQKQENYKRLVKGGWDNIIASAFVEAFDPTEIAALTAASYGLGTVPRIFGGIYKTVDNAADITRIGKRMYRSQAEAQAAQSILKNAVKGSATTMGTLAPFEAYRISENPMYSEEDFWTVMAFAGGLGGLYKGGTSYWRKLEHGEAFRRRMATVDKNPLTEAEKQKWSDLLDPTLFEKQMDKVAKAMSDEPASVAAKNFDEAKLMDDLARYEDELSKLKGDSLVKRVAALNKEFGDEIFVVSGGGDSIIAKGLDKLPEDVREQAKTALDMIIRGEGDTTLSNIQLNLEKGYNATRDLVDQLIESGLVKMGKTNEKGLITLEAKVDSLASAEQKVTVNAEKHKKWVGKQEAEARDKEFDPNTDYEDPRGLNKEPATYDNKANFEDAPKQLGSIPLLSFFLRERMSSTARIMASEDGFKRHLGQVLGLNSAGNVDRSPVAFDVHTIGNHLQQKSTIDFMIPIKDNMKKWQKLNGYNAGVNPIANMENDIAYLIEVGRAVRRGGSDDPLIQAGVNAWNKEAKYFLEESQKAFVKGSDNVKYDPSYLPRDYVDAELDRLIRTHGEAEVIKMFKGSIMAKQGDDIVEELAEMIAEGTVLGLQKRLVNRSLGNIPKFHMGFGTDEYDLMRLGLQSKLGEEEAEIALKTFKEQFGLKEGAKGGDGHIGRLKSRVNLDETYTHTFADGSSYSFDKLLNNNVMELHQGYTYQMGMAIGLARNGINRIGQESLDVTIEKMRMDAAKLGNRKEMDKALKEIDGIEFLYDGATGRLAHQAGMSEATEDMLRRIREFNFMRSMGASGIPTMVESASVIFEHTAAGVWKGLPHLRTMTSKLRNGDLADPLGRELMHVFGTGIDMYTGKVRTFFDDIETDMIRSRYNKTDMWLAKGRELTAVGSGMLPLTAIFRRADNMFFAYDWWAVAMKGAHKKHGRQPFADIKMEQLGLSPADSDLILKTMKKYGEADSKGRLKTLNTAKWSETDEGARALELFSLAGYRHATQIVQETNLGSVNRFIRSPWGKTLGQFLSYVLAAQEQQFQRQTARLMHGDKVAASRVLLAGSYVSMMAYMAGVHYRSMGMSEDRRKKYLEERLTPARMFTDGAIGYLGFFSFQSTILQRYREANLINNPTLDLSRLVMDGASELGKQLTEEEREVSEAKMSRFLSIIPSSLYPLGMARNAIADEIVND